MEVFDEIESKIISELEMIPNEGIKKDSQWTRRIKQLLSELGESLGNSICVSGFSDEYSGEWLYDIVWYKNDKNNNLQRVVLVVESEWKKKWNYLKFDFEKLLLSNSEYRLFICQSKPEKINDLIECFKNAVEIYTLLCKGDKILIAILNEITEEFIFESIVKK